MKRKLLLFTFLICSFNFDSYGQINPVENLAWSHWYEFYRNYFELRWDEPAQPHDEIIGYNVYRNNELFRFQTERTVYNLWTELYGIVSNCDNEQFLANNNQGEPYTTGIEMYVTAVYNTEQIESGYVQTYFDLGLLLPTKAFAQKKAALFPNPTRGVLNIEIENLDGILVYDVYGKVVKEFAPNTQIDLSNLSKGLYLIKLLSDKETIVEKIYVE